MVSLFVCFADSCKLFNGSSISFRHACLYRQRTRVDSLYGSRDSSPSNSNNLFLAPSILTISLISRRVCSHSLHFFKKTGYNCMEESEE